MSIIMIIAKQPISSSAIFKLHKLLAFSISEIKNCVASGLPIFDDEIFDNNYQEKSVVLKEIVKMSEDESINIDIIEFPEKDCTPKCKMTITKEILKNILNSADSERGRF